MVGYQKLKFWTGFQVLGLISKALYKRQIGLCVFPYYYSMQRRSTPKYAWIYSICRQIIAYPVVYTWCILQIWKGIQYFVHTENVHT